jgi:hypothetical protein
VLLIVKNLKQSRSQLYQKSLSFILKRQGRVYSHLYLYFIMSRSASSSLGRFGIGGVSKRSASGLKNSIDACELFISKVKQWPEKYKDYPSKLANIDFMREFAFWFALEARQNNGQNYSLKTIRKYTSHIKTDIKARFPNGAFPGDTIWIDEETWLKPINYDITIRVGRR